MIVKVQMTLHIDTEEYPMPVDGRVADEVAWALHEFVYDIDGMDIKKINVIQEGKNK